MIGTTLNQRFTLLKELGRGGMGAVYRATDQVLGRNVAIKVLREHSGEEAAKRIRLEAQILARLLHDNIVHLYDFGIADGVYFLVMEEVDGTTFARRWRHLPLGERLRVIAQVSEALDYAHRQGVIHRDIKPGNVLLTAADRPKLSDFGLSLISDYHTESEAIRGTPHYMSPEQAQGKRIDHRSDLYSLGIMLYESMTGTVPFVGKALSIITQHVHAAPEPPRARNPAISAELEALILSLLAKPPGDRPASGRSVAQVLRAELERAPGRGPLDAVPRNASAALGMTFGVGGAPRADAPTTTAPIAGAPGTPAFTTFGSTAPLVWDLMEEVVGEPLLLNPDERYLSGHYLAFLLGGARRRGVMLRRPSDPRNADRARLLLAMTYLVQRDGAPDALARAGRLLEERLEVRSVLNPVVVMKYLASRETPVKRAAFRDLRTALLDISPYAQQRMIDPNGVLNPGLMPQKLADLRKLAPERTEVDDLLVGRWNRVTEVWREHPEFREAVLRYATCGANRDPASAGLWPEVVYPLIERARRQRALRPQFEKVWDYLSTTVLRMPPPGVRLDREMARAVPKQLAAELDQEIYRLADESDVELAQAVTPPDEVRGARLVRHLAGSGVDLHELARDRQPRRLGITPLVNPDPVRFMRHELRALWQANLVSLGKSAEQARPGTVPIGGPYRLLVVPSFRGHEAGTVAIQGMPDKQIEMLTPSFRVGGSSTRPIVAVWLYHDQSLAIAYVDFQGNERYILWHALNAQQFTFAEAGELNHMAYHLGLEAPDQLDRALSNKFRPRSPTRAR